MSKGPFKLVQHQATSRQHLVWKYILELKIWSVAQSCISTNTGLIFTPVFQFVYFCMSVYFKTSEKKTPIDPDKIS